MRQKNSPREDVAARSRAPLEKVKPLTLGDLAKHADAVRFTCPCGHAGEVAIAELTMRRAWATPLAEIAAKARCSACGGREVTARPAWCDVLAAG